MEIYIISGLAGLGVYTIAHVLTKSLFWCFGRFFVSRARYRKMKALCKKWKARYEADEKGWGEAAHQEYLAKVSLAARVEELESNGETYPSIGGVIVGPPRSLSFNKPTPYKPRAASDRPQHNQAN